MRTRDRTDPVIVGIQSSRWIGPARLNHRPGGELTLTAVGLLE